MAIGADNVKQIRINLLQRKNIITMKKIFLFVLPVFLLSCATKIDSKKELTTKILSNTTMQKVDEMARNLMKKGFYAGSGYQMVWARDLNTFIELSCEEYDTKIIRENLLMFFHFQQEKRRTA